MGILKILEKFLGFMGLFGLYGMFLISFGFLCIFFGLFGAFELDFRSFIKIFFHCLFNFRHYLLFGAINIDFDCKSFWCFED